ncbi:MAG: ATPase [Proteobacteria bacterium]|nr:ATPase [Pseudomonadota bacterium]
MFFGDAGSSWCKTYRQGDDTVRIVPTRTMSTRDLHFAYGTGHTARRRSARFENDLISLSKGALTLIDAADFTVLDLGSRDTKVVAFRDRTPTKLDWSVGCAAATGATIEMLGKFYDIDFATVAIDDRWTPVTCGTYAVERIMDAVSAGEDIPRAIGRFIHGLARNCFDFSGRPDALYLSGGFCDNAPFISALSRYTQVTPLGRTVPLCGLWAFAAEEGHDIGALPDALRHSRCTSED